MSGRARVMGSVARGAVVLGPSVIGESSYLDIGTVAGYPRREGLLRLRDTGGSFEELDGLSEGARIGRNCVVRVGSIIYEGVEIRDDVELGHSVLIRSGSVVGEGSRIGSYCQLDGSVSIGRASSIQSMSYLPHGTIVGSNVFIGPLVCVTNDLYPPSRKLVGVVIEDDAVIGANALLLSGITIGRGAVVAAGSVVTRSVEPETLVMGSPARPVGSRRDYEEKKRLYEAGEYVKRRF